MAEVPSMEIVQRPIPAPVNVATMSDEELGRMIRVAQDLAKSGLFPDAMNAHKAFAKILLGRDLGLSPTQALTGIYIVEGRPQIAAVTLAHFIRKTPGLGYKVTEHTADTCSIEFYADGELRGTSTFTISEARSAGLVKEKSGWVKYPRNMLFARAMSNGAKWYVPEVLGGLPVYTEGDSFEGTAQEIGSGQGDGSEPGWGATSVESAAQVEAVIERARALGHAGLSERATAQMGLAGQPDSVIAMWCEQAGRELDEFEARQSAPAVETVADAPGWEPVAPRTEAEHEAAQAELDSVLDRISAEEAEDEPDEAVLTDLRDRQEALEDALGHDDGQESMPL